MFLQLYVLKLAYISLNVQINTCTQVILYVEFYK